MIFVLSAAVRALGFEILDNQKYHNTRRTAWLNVSPDLFRMYTVSPFSKDHQKLQYAACMTLLKKNSPVCILRTRNVSAPKLNTSLRSVSLGMPRARQRAISRSNFFSSNSLS